MKNSQEILDNELELSGHARFLKKYGMYSAALYYKNLNEPIERRAARRKICSQKPSDSELL